MLNSVFELLFKYRPVVFERGHLVFSAPRIVSFVVLALALLGIVVLWRYRTTGGRSSLRIRVGLLVLRGAVLVLVLVALLRPALLVSTAVPERNVVGILLDDSQSMQITDDGTVPRADQLRQLFGGSTSPIPAALAERFQVRFYRFSRSAERTGNPEALSHDGGRSDLATALDDVRRDLAALPLAGLVLVSDGADNADSSVTRALLALSAAEIPVYTVGIGSERLRNDLELVRVEAPRVALQGSSVVVEALVRQSGSGRDSLELVVEESGQRLAAQRFAPPGDGQATTVRVPVALPTSGARELVVRVPALSNEPITRNNERRLFVSVLDRTEDILYFEGEPRFEFAFMRR
ncbi:MAG: VWA domain-containing protein, partial [Gemmatimonadales bacterium]